MEAANRPAALVIVALTSGHTAGNLPYGASKGALDRIVMAGSTASCCTATADIDCAPV